jgi:hypothetical protein
MSPVRKRIFAVSVLAASLLGLALLAGLSSSGLAALQALPLNTAPPTISGTPQRGQTLAADPGNWSGTRPISFSYQWRRCDAVGGSCSSISGAVRKAYALASVDVGNTLRIRVKAQNSDGSSMATSVPTAVIKKTLTLPPAQPVRCSGPAPLSVAGITSPEQLAIDGQQLTPQPVGGSTQRLTVRFHVSCLGKSVEGALVYATAVPFHQFSVPPEQVTGPDGWAQLSLSRQAGYPATRQQQLLVFFVRARKPGETLLGGISARRLVSFPVDLHR